MLLFFEALSLLVRLRLFDDAVVEDDACVVCDLRIVLLRLVDRDTLECVSFVLHVSALYPLLLHSLQYRLLLSLSFLGNVDVQAVTK